MKESVIVCFKYQTSVNNYNNNNNVRLRFSSFFKGGELLGFSHPQVNSTLKCEATRILGNDYKICEKTVWWMCVPCWPFHLEQKAGRRILGGQIRIKDSIYLGKSMPAPWQHKATALAKTFIPEKYLRNLGLFKSCRTQLGNWLASDINPHRLSISNPKGASYNHVLK